MRAYAKAALACCLFASGCLSSGGGGGPCAEHGGVEAHRTFTDRGGKTVNQWTCADGERIETRR